MKNKTNFPILICLLTMMSTTEVMANYSTLSYNKNVATRPFSVSAFLGTGELSVSEEYLQAGYDLHTTATMATGFSMSDPGDFHYALVNIHPESMDSWAFMYEVGLAHYTTTEEYNGLLLGFGMAYPVNTYATFTTMIRYMDDITIGDEDSGQMIVSVGGTLKFGIHQ